MQPNHLLAALEDVGEGSLDALELLTELDLHDIARVLAPSFVHAGRDSVLATGNGRHYGDVTGVLALSRAAAADLSQRSVPYVYCIAAGDTDDFEAIERCRGFVTPN